MATKKKTKTPGTADERKEGRYARDLYRQG